MEKVADILRTERLWYKEAVLIALYKRLVIQPKTTLLVATIVLCLSGAVALDVFVFPLDSRAGHPSGLILTVLYLLAIGATIPFKRWRHLVLVAAMITAVSFVGPIYLAYQSVDVTETILLRRFLSAVLVWFVALLEIHRTQRMQALGSEVDALAIHLHALTDIVFDGVVITENGIIRQINERCAERIGYEASTVVGQPALDFVAPVFRNKVAQSFEIEKIKEPIEIALRTRDGSTIHVECVATDFKIGDRKMRISGLRDIGQRLKLRREIVTIGEQERTRIAYDLHDHVGQLLVSAKWAAETLCRQLEEKAIGLASDGRRLTDLIEHAIDETRRVSSRLAPQAVDSLEIYPALSLLSVDVNKHPNVQCTLHCAQHERLDAEETAIHLYRIAEEAVSNVLKHSHAKHIELNFVRNGDTCTLEVLDDGIGMPTKSEREEGLGVRSMKYRAQLIRGTVDIAPRSEGGTRLACSFSSES